MAARDQESQSTKDSDCRAHPRVFLLSRWWRELQTDLFQSGAFFNVYWKNLFFIVFKDMISTELVWHSEKRLWILERESDTRLPSRARGWLGCTAGNRTGRRCSSPPLLSETRLRVDTPQQAPDVNMTSDWRWTPTSERRCFLVENENRVDVRTQRQVDVRTQRHIDVRT